jgi:hypothetical protein
VGEKSSIGRSWDEGQERRILVIGPTLPFSIEEGMIVGDLVKLSGEMRRMAGNQNRESKNTINPDLAGDGWPLSILAAGASDWWS